MQKEPLLREPLPLKKQESFIIESYTAVTYTAPLHHHHEFQLCFIVNGTKLNCTIGNNIHKAEETELLLLGPNLAHKWETRSGNDKKINIVFIYFNDRFIRSLSKKKHSLLNHLFEKAGHGIVFSANTAAAVKDKLFNIIQLKKKAALAQITDVLGYMANDQNLKLLNIDEKGVKTDETIKVLDAYLKKNYRKKVSLEEVCSYIGKSITSFNRYIKNATGTTFTNYLNRIRIGFAARHLIETTESVAAIAKTSGFNNLAHFNRVFKKTFGTTPLRYREVFYGRKKFM